MTQRRSQPADEAEELDGDDRQRQEDADDRAEPGAGRYAEDIRRDQRIAEEALIGGPGRGERGADQRSREDARQADVEDTVSIGWSPASPPSRRARVDRTSSGGMR